MKIKEKLKKTRRNSIIAKIVILMSMLYLLMIAVKGLYFLTDGNSFGFLAKINEVMRWIIVNTYFTPLNFVWDKIPSTLYESGDPFLFYKVIIPPAVLFMVSNLFIRDHRLLKAEYAGLKDEIEKEITLRDMRKDAGIHTVSESATIDVIINNATNSDPLWHNTWWSKIILAISIALLLVPLGFK